MASPSGPRAPVAPALAPGDLLSGRYRLLGLVAEGVGATTVWQATDEVLARKVAVKVLPATGRAASAVARPFLEAAGRAGQLSHPTLARVYDAAVEEWPAERGTRTVDVAYVVSEWVDGRTLSEVLRADGVLEPAEAVRLTQEAAAAIGAAHAAGVGHGRVHPGNLMISDTGRLRVTDAAVAAAVHGEPVAPPDPESGLPAAEVARDTRDLAAVLYALLTARWPAAATPVAVPDLPAAPKPSTGALYAPRQVRAGVPRTLDAVVLRALDPARAPGRNPLSTPRALAQALDEAGPELRAPAPAKPTAPARRRLSPGRIRWAVPKLIALAVIVAIGVTGYSVGKRVGALPRKQGALDALAAPSASPGTSGPPTARIDLAAKPVAVRDYDPFGRDGSEQPSTVPNAFDGDPTTAWTTDGYSSATFGGLKPGVGLLVDLGTPTRLSSVQVGLVRAGASVELRSTNAVGDNADAFTTVAHQSDGGQVVDLKPSSAAAARYWLVWFTSLPKGDGGRYRDGIAELVFNRITG